MDGKSKPQVRRRYEKTLLYANMVGIYPELPSRSRFSHSGITLALLAGFLIGMLFVSGCNYKESTKDRSMEYECLRVCDRTYGYFHRTDSRVKDYVKYASKCVESICE